MSRSNKPLPSIPVKHVPIRKVVTISKPLEAKLHAYIVYYTEQQGLDPKQAPTETDTIVALIENHLARDQGFNRYRRDKQVQRPASVPEQKASASDPKSI